jgi:hypothetical protein
MISDPSVGPISKYKYREQAEGADLHIMISGPLSVNITTGRECHIMISCITKYNCRNRLREESVKQAGTL